MRLSCGPGDGSCERSSSSGDKLLDRSSDLGDEFLGRSFGSSDGIFWELIVVLVNGFLSVCFFFYPSMMVLES